jgi:hypothetical protein
MQYLTTKNQFVYSDRKNTNYKAEEVINIYLFWIYFIFIDNVNVSIKIHYKTAVCHVSYQQKHIWILLKKRKRHNQYSIQ